MPSGRSDDLGCAAVGLERDRARALDLGGLFELLRDVLTRRLVRLVEIVVERHDLECEHDGGGRSNRGNRRGDPHRPPPATSCAPRRELVAPLLALVVDDVGFDAGPQLGRRGLVDRGCAGEDGDGLAQLVDLGAGLLVAFHVSLDQLALVGLEGVEHVHAEEFVHLGAGFDRRHWCTPASMSAARSRSSPDRIRLLTVPSGCSSKTATSL